jgi:hypothetical protein
MGRRCVHGGQVEILEEENTALRRLLADADRAREEGDGCPASRAGALTTSRKVLTLLLADLQGRRGAFTAQKRWETFFDRVPVILRSLLSNAVFRPHCAVRVAVLRRVVR